MIRYVICKLSFLLGVLLLINCNRAPHEPGIENDKKEVDEKSAEIVLNEPLKTRVGSWIDKGKVCYGIVISENIQGKTIGKPVKCKVISIQPDKIKVKAIEKVSLMEGIGCDKVGISYGETWWESEGDLFLSREEANAFLKEKKWTID